MFTAIITALISGSFIVLATLVAKWYQKKNAGKIRAGEIKAERQEKAQSEAHRRIKELISRLMQECDEDVLGWMNQNIRWAVDCRPYLPGRFYDNWMSIRASLREAATLEGTLKELEDPQQRGGLLDKLHKYKPYCETLADEALSELERVMGLTPVKLKYPPESK